MKARDTQRGYAIIMILFMAAVLLILLGTAMPRIVTQGQREKEEELIFRGQQYARGVRLYYRKYGRFPTELDDLVKVNNNLRFLRKLYPDPMNPDGKWRLIRVGPGGNLIGNIVDRPPLKVPPAAPAVRPAAPPGGTEMPGSQPPEPPPAPPPQKPTPQTGEGSAKHWPMPGAMGQLPAEGAPPEGQSQAPTPEQQQAPVVPGFGYPTGSTGTPPSGTPPVQGGLIPGMSAPTQPGTPPGAMAGREEPQPNPEDQIFGPEPPEQQPPQPQPSFGGPPAAATGSTTTPPTAEAEPQIFGAGIVGVASNSARESIRVYHGHTKYNEWEFIYDPASEMIGFGTPPGGRLGPPSGIKPFGPSPKR